MLKHAMASALLLLATSLHAETKVDVDGPWIREAPPGMPMMAGYATLKNTGATTINIVDVDSDAFADIELHTTEMVDGVARMIQQEKLVVPAEGELSLAPGGYHLMLMKPKAQYSAGDKIDMSLKFEDGSSQNITFEVKKGGTMGGMNHDHHKH